MIAEAIIGSVTVITLGALWLADRIHKREADEGDFNLAFEQDVVTPGDAKYSNKKDSIARQRGLLERQRATWKEVLDKNNIVTTEERLKAAVEIKKVDEDLIKLAREEGSL